MRNYAFEIPLPDPLNAQLVKGVCPITSGQQSIDSLGLDTSSIGDLLSGNGYCYC